MNKFEKGTFGPCDKYSILTFININKNKRNKQRKIKKFNKLSN